MSIKFIILKIPKIATKAYIESHNDLSFGGNSAVLITWFMLNEFAILTKNSSSKRRATTLQINSSGAKGQWQRRNERVKRSIVSLP